MTEKLAVGGDTLPSPKRYSSEIMLMKFRLLTTFLCVQLAVSEEKAMAPHSNGTPLQWYSYLENPMDGGAWWAAVHGVAKSWTRLRDFTFTFHFPLSCTGEGNGKPLQCSCLENPRDGGAWWAVVYGVTQSRTRLKRLSSNSSNP